MSLNQPQFFKEETKIPKGVKKIRIFENSVKELFFIDNPQYKKDIPGINKLLTKFKRDKAISGVWIYLPWDKTAIHTVSEDLYFELRTARNRNLITEEEQLKYRNFRIGIAGLSVGSAILETLTLSGGPKRIKLADPDVIELTNLNRMRATLGDVGCNKTFIAAQRVWRIDPFADLQIWDKGLQESEINKFLTGGYPIDLFIDEMDDLRLKVLARFKCKELGIPVVMATDIGDRIMLDIERFDQEPLRPPFHGLTDLSPNSFKKMTKDKWLKLSTIIIDSRNMPKRLLSSISQVGLKLGGVPQLGSTTTMAGGVVAFAVRQIACGFDMPSGRYLINLEKELGGGKRGQIDLPVL